MKSVLTKEGLRNSLYTALEFGYKMCEKNHNLQKTLHDAHPDIEALVDMVDLPSELVAGPLIKRAISLPRLESGLRPKRREARRK